MKRELTQGGIGIPACVLLIMMTANAFAVEKKELIPLIKEASIKQESAYLEARNKIVEYGTNALPLLAWFAVDETLPWQQRLVARICYERIEREKEITKLLETDWYKHPKFNPEWNEYLGGPEGHMYGMVVADFKEAGLWYYYLELEWKATDEHSTIRDRRNGYWASCGTAAVKDNPEERVWFLRVCAEILTDAPPRPVPNTRGYWLQHLLLREEKSDAIHVLEHRTPPPVTSEPPFRLGTKIIKPAKQP